MSTLHFMASAGMPVFGQTPAWVPSTNPAGLTAEGPVNIISTSNPPVYPALPSTLRLINTEIDDAEQSSNDNIWEFVNSNSSNMDLIFRHKIKNLNNSINNGIPIYFTHSGEGKFYSLSTTTDITSGGVGSFNWLNSSSNITADGQFTSGSAGTSGMLTLNGSLQAEARPLIKFTNNDIAVFSNDNSGSATVKDFYFVSNFSQSRTKDAKISIFGSGNGFTNALSIGQYGSYGQIDNAVGVLRLASPYGVSIRNPNSLATNPNELLFTQNANLSTISAYSADNTTSAGVVAIHGAGGVKIIKGTATSAPIDGTALQVDGGSVLIGNSVPTTGTFSSTSTRPYKLAVDGVAVFKTVAVLTTTEWPDYVFEPNYKLSSLDSTSKYIEQNKHLPGVPSAAEVKTNGYSVADMDVAVLKKLEELYLHVIELKKENEALRNEIKALK